MSKLIKAFAVLGITVTVAACGSSNDEVVVVPPITADPVDTKF